MQSTCSTFQHLPVYLVHVLEQQCAIAGPHCSRCSCLHRLCSNGALCSGQACPAAGLLVVRQAPVSQQHWGGLLWGACAAAALAAACMTAAPITAAAATAARQRLLRKGGSAGCCGQMHIVRGALQRCAQLLQRRSASQCMHASEEAHVRASAFNAMATIQCLREGSSNHAAVAKATLVDLRVLSPQAATLTPKLATESCRASGPALRNLEDGCSCAKAAGGTPMNSAARRASPRGSARKSSYHTVRVGRP